MRKNKTDWPCRRCGECCLNIPIDGDIVNRMRDRFQRDIVEEVNSPEQIDGHPRFITIRTPDGWCVFLDPNNRCTIYEDRPEICKVFGRRPGVLECFYITPSGRVRTAEESQRTKKKVKRINLENSAKFGKFDEKLFGIHYTYDD